MILNKELVFFLLHIPHSDVINTYSTGGRRTGLKMNSFIANEIGSSMVIGQTTCT